mmetsp:Transcript_4427/g.13399  ORF Transcript_4427/g.13399 Transcript_4427/m.13399 type:complete len:203 (-) Transcript_4427:357-965(-)
MSPWGKLTTRPVASSSSVGGGVATSSSYDSRCSASITSAGRRPLSLSPSTARMTSPTRRRWRVISRPPRVSFRTALASSKAMPVAVSEKPRSGRGTSERGSRALRKATLRCSMAPESACPHSHSSSAAATSSRAPSFAARSSAIRSSHSESIVPNRSSTSPCAAPSAAMSSQVRPHAASVASARALLSSWKAARRGEWCSPS